MTEFTASRPQSPDMPPPDALRRRLLQQGGLAALALALPGAGRAAGGPGMAEAVDWGRQAIRQAMAGGRQAPAVSVALLVDGELAWQEAFGWALPGQARATPRTRFNIGSVSKVLAALAAVILQDRGLIRLDTPVADYLPDFSMLSPEYRRITVRHLLSHSSGLPGTNGRDIFAFAPLPGYAADTEASLARTHLKHAPGELAVYCNDGFTLIEQVVLAVTCKPYPAFVQAAILDPLGMRDSGYGLAPLPAGSYGHAVWRGRTLGQEFVSAYATGGLASTPGDMMRLARMFIDGGVFEGRRIVSEAGVAEMGRDQTAGLAINPCPEWRWGLGWDSTAQFGLAAAGVPCWEKNGGTAFYATEFFVLPQARMALLLTGSGQGYNPTAIAEGVLLRALRGRGAIRALPAPAGRDVPPQVAVEAELPREAAGIYGNNEGPYQASFAPDLSLEIHRWQAGKWQPVAEGLRLRSDGWWWTDAPGASSFRFDMAPGHRYLI
ncbi:MAG TPA: serine hydrolase domain-containing protein, partial [Bordetella sp.]